MESLEFLKSIVPDLEIICKHFGPDNQLQKLDEECGEFRESREQQEIVDVAVVSLQLVLSVPGLKEIMLQKIARTIARIANGYYEIKGE